MWQAIELKSAYLFLAQEAISKLTHEIAKNKEWVCPLCKENVYLKRKFERTKNKKIEIVRSCFAHKPNSRCKGIGESDTHYQRKCFVASQLFSEKINLKVGKIPFTIKQEDIKGIELTRKGNEINRADILIEFNEYNPIFAKGIVIEIVVSEETESIENKFEKWTTKGYSFTSLQSFDFDNFELKEPEIQIMPHLISVKKYYQKINEKISDRLISLKDWKTKLEENMQEQMESLQEKIEHTKKILSYDKEKIIEEITKKIRVTCTTCYHQSIDNKNPKETFCCWVKRNKNKEIQEHPDKFSLSLLDTYSCEEWISK